MGEIVNDPYWTRTLQAHSFTKLRSTFWGGKDANNDNPMDSMGWQAMNTQLQFFISSAKGCREYGNGGFEVEREVAFHRVKT